MTTATGFFDMNAANIWNSRRVGSRPEYMAGLAEVTLRANPAQRAAINAPTGGDRFADPWGTGFVLAD